MSLTKEVSHDLRTVTTQPADLAVLPPWAKVLPLAFYAGFAFFLVGMAYNTFVTNIHNARRDALGRIIEQYNQMLTIDRQTTARLVDQRNASVRVARWVDYSPMTQAILMGIFSSLDERTQINSLMIERKEGVIPEYTLSMSFRASQGDIGIIIKNMREGLAKRGWSLTIGNQVYQESVTSVQGYLQPAPSAMPLESQYLSVLQDPNRAVPPTPAAPATGGSQ